MSDPQISEEELGLAVEEMHVVAYFNSCKAIPPGKYSPAKFQLAKCRRASGHIGFHVSATLVDNRFVSWPGDDE